MYQKLVLFLLCISMVGAPAVEYRLQQCGTVLVNTLSQTCGGLYPQKRSEPYTEVYRYQDDESYDDNFSEKLLDKQDAKQMRANRIQRHTGLLVEECCRKSCSLDEFQSYCTSSK